MRERRRPEPAGHATDLHHVGHHEVRRMCFDGVLHVQGSPPVFPTLDRGLRFARHERVADVVVSQCRFFDPGETFLVEDP